MKIKPELYLVVIESNVWVSSQEEYDSFIESINRTSFLQLNTVLEGFGKGGYNHYTFLDKEHYVINKDQLVELTMNGIQTNSIEKVEVEVDVTQQLLEAATSSTQIQIDISSDKGLGEPFVLDV